MRYGSKTKDEIGDGGDRPPDPGPTADGARADSVGRSRVRKRGTRTSGHAAAHS